MNTFKLSRKADQVQLPSENPAMPNRLPNPWMVKKVAQEAKSESSATPPVADSSAQELNSSTNPAQQLMRHAQEMMRQAEQRHREAVEVLEETQREREHIEARLRFGESKRADLDALQDMLETQSIRPKEESQFDNDATSTAVKTIAAGDVVMTLMGKRFYFRGPVSDKWNMGHPALSMPIDKTWNGQENNYWVEFGTHACWIMHSHDRKRNRCKTRTSKNLFKEYPGLAKKLPSTTKCAGGCISLGPDQTFFADISDRATIYHTTPAVEQRTGDVRNFQSLWFGYGGAHYGILKNGKARWDFCGHYPELEAALHEVPADWSIIQLCLDISCKDQWIVVWSNGNYKYKLCDRCDALQLDFPEWLEENGLSAAETKDQDSISE